MIILDSLDTIYTEPPTALAIGKFDGVHKGHRKLLDHILRAQADGLTSCVFTFEPSPDKLFGSNKGQILSRDEKRGILEELGVGILVEYPLDRNTAAIDPAEFITEFLCRRLKAGLIAAGADLSFGAGGKGDFALLNAYRYEYGYETVQVDKMHYQGGAISSSRIRDMLEEGLMEDAAACLGRTYSFTGVVERGKRIGHSIGFPTLNITPDKDKIMPPRGVYESVVMLGGCAYKGMSNIGMKPTVKEDGNVNLETHLFDFDEEAYGEEITVGLRRFIRPERRFEGLDALKAQLNADMEKILRAGP